MALINLTGIMLLLIAILRVVEFYVTRWLKARAQRMAESKQASRGLVPDKYLPPELRESVAFPESDNSGLVQRKMAPREWQERQSSIKQYWMENPEARPR